MSEFKIEISVGCASSVQADGTIGLCAKLVNGGYTLNDQSSIIWHEAYHARNDDPWSKKEREVPPGTGYSNIPPDIKDCAGMNLYGERVSLIWHIKMK